MNADRQKEKLITKAVSMPAKLWKEVLSRVRKTDEGNFSRYVRRLAKADLEKDAT